MLHEIHKAHIFIAFVLNIHGSLGVYCPIIRTFRCMYTVRLTSNAYKSERYFKLTGVFSERKMI